MSPGKIARSQRLIHGEGTPYTARHSESSSIPALGRYLGLSMMNGEADRVRRYPAGGLSVVFASLLMLGHLAGCSVYLGTGLWSDPRISMKEFLELEEEARLAAEVPATQPVVDMEAARALLDSQFGPYRVGPHDVLTVMLTEVSGLVGGTGLSAVRVRVDRNGQINLPIVGNVSVDGLELKDIENLIADTYVPKVYREAICHVTLAEYEATEVIVTGTVGAPGMISLRRTERNLLYALVLAGGISNDSSGWVTLQRLRRPGDIVKLNIMEPEGVKQALMEDPLEDGDMITADPADPFQVWVLGLVKGPGPQVFVPGQRVTFLEVLAAARGLRQDIFVREGTLNRKMPDGSEIRVRLDIERLASGRDPNFVMQPGDIVYVNHTWDTWIQEWFNQHATITAGATATVSYSASASDQLSRRGTPTPTPGAGIDPFGFLQRGLIRPATAAATGGAVPAP